MIDITQISTLPPKDLKKKKTKKKTAELLQELQDLQHLMFAQEKHSLLVVLQGMDASGKDGATRKVFGVCNPQGVRVSSFKAPTKEELAHDFLWRVHKKTPAKGMIKIFNRSHYEDILITRVEGWCDDKTAEQRIIAINNFEQLLLDSGTKILKFYLHISEESQRESLQERIDNPKKHWKHNPGDWESAKKWPQYRKVYNEAINKCNVAPWQVIPSDKNWYKEYLIAKSVVETLREMNLEYPKLEA
jgi:PPK2 family polyphosphate:nucleotide phosphotransferase